MGLLVPNLAHLGQSVLLGKLVQLKEGLTVMEGCAVGCLAPLERPAKKFIPSSRSWQRQGWQRQTPCLVKVSFSSPRRRKWLVRLAFSAEGSPLQLFKAKVDFFWIDFNC